MPNEFISTIVNDNLDWFLKKDLKSHYDKRREILIESSQPATTVIDYILQNFVDQNASYPPESNIWQKYALNSQKNDKHQIIRQILIIYLQLDIGHYLSHKETTTTTIRTRTKDKTELASLEHALIELTGLFEAYDLKSSVVHFVTGLWAVDNDQKDLIIKSLTNPSINLDDYFTSPREIVKLVIDSLVITHQPRLALYIGRVFKYDLWFEDYDPVYCFLLFSTGQLSEALKYERMFIEKENYREVLDRFFELGTEWNVVKSIKSLDLSEEEEEVLNHHLSLRSRPVTPSSSQQPKQSSNLTSTTTPKHKPRNRNIQNLQRKSSFNDSPARNTRSARKKIPAK